MKLLMSEDGVVQLRNYKGKLLREFEDVDRVDIYNQDGLVASMKNSEFGEVLKVKSAVRIGGKVDVVLAMGENRGD